MTDDRLYDVTMPKLTDSMEEGRIVDWHVKPGDPVVEGDVLAEIETDKAVMDLESFRAGTVTEIVEGAGGVVAVGAVIARIDSTGLKTSMPPPEISSRDRTVVQIPTGPGQKTTTGRPDRVAPGSVGAEWRIPVPGGHPVGSGEIARPPHEPAARHTFDGRSTGSRGASPRARRLAAEKNVDLTRIEGTGPGGRITGDDVLRARSPHTVSPRPSPAPPRADRADEDLPTVAFGPDEAEAEPVSFYQMASIRRVVASKHVVPHFYLETTVRAEALLAGKTAQKGRTDATVTHLLLHAAAAALADVPEANRSYDRGRWIRWKVVNLGLAVQTDAGLAVAVLRDAGGKPLPWIVERTRDLVDRARAGKLRPEERTNPTFTLSNLGAHQVDRFSAIINPPSAITLAAGAIRGAPVVEGGEVVAGRVLTLTLSCDHRVVDGVTAARFATALGNHLGAGG